MKNLFFQNKKILFAVIFMTSFFNSYAQLSPPGLGKAKAASWFAFGIKQSLDSLEHKVSTTYVGLGYKSDPDNSDPFTNMAILVLNQEISNRFHENWEYSYGLSYRRSNLYDSSAPFEELNPGIEQEFRVYGRFSYITGTDRITWKNTIRQEFRKFFNPDFSKTDENFQLRTRLKTQINFDLGTQKIHHIIGYAEALFAISNENFPKRNYSNFNYKEARLGLYYSITPKDIPFTFDLGYMHNIIGNSDVVDVNYLAIDVVWKNPFGKK
ncbi:MAG: hypothetical protein WA749_10840 [Gelidibacter sp.]